MSKSPPSQPSPDNSDHPPSSHGSSEAPASAGPASVARARASDARRTKMLTAPVPRTLIDLAVPMVIGIAAIILFQVVDTIFVGQLGTRELAAMTFTFPVAYVIFSVTMGVGIGTTSVIARAIGEGDRSKVRRLTTHALILAMLLVMMVVALGLVLADRVFLAMGAAADLLPLIRSYMVPWFCGVPLLVIPMVGNSAIRATGDTKTPSFIMMVAGVMNVVLDPVLIFGWGPIPALGLPGAAYATMASWLITFFAAAWLLIKRERLIVLKVPRLGQLLNSWGKVLYVGLPAAATNLLIPLSTAVITRFISAYGEVAVAGYGAATRLEALSLVGINGLATALTPFIGQNYGSKNHQRVREAVYFVFKAAMAWGAMVAGILLLFARPLASLFAKDSVEVTEIAVGYLQVVPLSYGLLGIAIMMNTGFTAMNRPFRAGALVSIRLFGLAVPLAYIGSLYWQLPGVFGGVAVGNAIVGVVGILMMLQFLHTTLRVTTAVRP